MNTVSAGPLKTMAGKGIPGFEQIADAWSDARRSGGTSTDPTPVGNTIAFLLSDLSDGITGELIHVDGGFHAMGTDLDCGASSAHGTPNSSPSQRLRAADHPERLLEPAAVQRPEPRGIDEIVRRLARPTWAT